MHTPSNPYSRRDLLRISAVGLAGACLPSVASPQAAFPSKRPAPQSRSFRSPAVDAEITRVAGLIRDPELAWLFSNCLPNTLDTTVRTGSYAGHPDTAVITGDITAMWLRDSSAQVWPYLPFLKQDQPLATMIEGLIRRQTRCILIDPYANAFLTDLTSTAKMDWSKNDKTEMRPGVGERKWEVDSLCYPVRLAHRYWKETGDTSPFDAQWLEAMHSIVKTFREQQRKSSPGPYHFQRASEHPTETLGEEGFGTPARSVGLIHSGFRPSDDACTYPLNIPANFFAIQTLHRLEEMFAQIAHDSTAAHDAASLATEIEAALKQYATVRHPKAGLIWAFEIDGFGNALCMDDANVPSLLSLPYLGACSESDPLYAATRRFVLSDANPYFFKGSAAEGIGGPHVGQNMIWPMSLIMRALTTHDEAEQVQCLRWLKKSSAGTGFIHESFNKDDVTHFTRDWFAWANTLFGELILTLAKTNPRLLAASTI